MATFQPWYHGNITRSRAEDLLSKAAMDGSFLLRGSESIPGAYALCVLFQNCVYTYRILPNEERKLSVQASEGVPIRFFSVIGDLVEYYSKENMGLVTNLQFPVQNEEERAEEPEDEPEPINIPPQLPPRNFTTAISVTEGREVSSEAAKGTEIVRSSLSDTFLQRLQNFDTSNLSEEHLKSIQEYFRVNINSDAEQVLSGNFNLPLLKKLIMGLCKNLNSEISRTIPTLECLQKVMDQQLSPGGGRLKNQISTDASLGSICSKVGELHSLLLAIEDKTRSAVFESVGYDGGHRNSMIPPVTFEVKVDSLGLTGKLQLKVDVETGKVIVKKSKDGPEDKFYTHNKILQLIKSQKVPNKLMITVETEKEKTQKKDYIFADSKKREGFCQLLQQMKNKHSDKSEPDMITIFIGTWNMGNANPPSQINSWFLSKGQGKTRDDTADYIPHDIYVIGTQEDQLGEREWMDILKSTLKNITNIPFKPIAIHTLWNIRIAVLARPEHENRISHVCQSSVKTGIANALGNKGAVGVSFMFNGTSFGFVNSHLTSGSEKKIRRNQNYMSILRFLNLGDKKLNPFDITHRFTHLFWLGDLNYRIEMPSTEAENIVTTIKQQQHQDLLCKDQLTIERADRKVFLYFEEEDITFAPTYRYERHTHERYVYTKAKATGTKYNLPSWCDRVLWKSYPMVHVVCQSYGCTSDIMTSDHCPVFATFEVGVTSQFVSKNDPDNTDAPGGIKFMNCVAILKTKSKTRFFIEFHSSCLENFVKSTEGENKEHQEGSLKVRFGAPSELTPIISDPEYLLDQHILISVKSTDCDESYGEGCVALRTAEFCTTDFSIPLTHHGEHTGDFNGTIQLRTSKGKQREKLYDFVKIERDDAAVQKLGTVMRESTWGPDHGAVKLPHLSPTDISNPSYMGVGLKAGGSPDLQPPGSWNYDQPPKQSPPGIGGHSDPPPPSRSPLSPKKTGQTVPSHSQTGKPGEHFSQQSVQTPDDGKPPEMFDNPLYGSMGHKQKARDRKDQDAPWANRKVLAIPDAHFSFPKNQEEPPFPTPRIRSFTCSETKGATPSTLQPPCIAKKPVVPSRSDVGMLTYPRPPLPAKSRAGPAESPLTKPRDYRDSSEFPNNKGKPRGIDGPPMRPSQPVSKEVNQEAVPGAKKGRPVR